MERLKAVLEDWLPQQLLGARVEIDPLRRGYKISGIVIWQGFDGLEPIDRYTLLWKHLRAHLNRKDQARISMIITLTPAEYAVLREPQLV